MYIFLCSAYLYDRMAVTFDILNHPVLYSGPEIVGVVNQRDLADTNGTIAYKELKTVVFRPLGDPTAAIHCQISKNLSNPVAVETYNNNNNVHVCMCMCVYTKNLIFRFCCCPRGRGWKSSGWLRIYCDRPRGPPPPLFTRTN